jgi:hypothetical protein
MVFNVLKRRVMGIALFNYVRVLIGLVRILLDVHVWPVGVEIFGFLLFTFECLTYFQLVRE